MRGTEHDVFPAQVSVIPPESPISLADLNPFRTPESGYHFTTTRVTVANGRVLIARDEPTSPNGPVLVLLDTIETFTPAPTRDGKSTIVTTSGTKIAYIRDAACGCGSRLRSWNPMRFMLDH